MIDFYKISKIAISVMVIPLMLNADSNFRASLEASGFIHEPIPPETGRSLEARAADKKILADVGIDRFDDLQHWAHQGAGEILEAKESGGIMLHFIHPDGVRARGSADDPDYALYGHCMAAFAMNGANIDKYNRIAVDILPECPGARVVNINMLMVNDPDASIQCGMNQPTGYHLMHLDNNRWNRCYLEIADLQRNKVKEIRFSISLNGRDLTTEESAKFTIANMRMQQVDDVDLISGWQPADNKIIYSMTGYDCSGTKTAVISEVAAHNAKQFQLIDATTGKIAYNAPIQLVDTSIGRFGEIDFSAFKTPGSYLLMAGDNKTEPFRIGNDSIWTDSRWRVLNFIFCQRCGYHVPSVHGKCHTDLFARHGDTIIPYSGGWHDAGDLSQQTLQTADVTYALFESANKLSASDPVLSARLREEALWGLDFVIRNRFGDGYRASSMGLLIWQDGKTGSYDDISTVRVQDVSFDNFLYAGYEAYAAMSLDNDPMLHKYLTKVACEDFRLAAEKYAQSGFGGFINAYEHSYNTSLSQFMATISWAASQLFRLTGNELYAAKAAECADYVLECQETQSVSDANPLRGFFYRDKNKGAIVHFIHQSREQIYMQALTELCNTQPANSSCERWRNAIALYAEYIKRLMAYTAPYGMIPSGVYRDDEYLDREGFYALHLFPPSNAEQLYTEQLKCGEQIAPHFYVRRFPIWFNIFNGNLAVHTSMGKAAAICGNFMHDEDLLDIGREQLYWIVGKNPFGQSLIYGEGYNYPALNSFSSGLITGSIPVGIRSLGNSDIPYWPQINNACYKEVWVTSAGKWLSLLAEY